MGRQGKTYRAEFRRQMVGLVHSGRSAESLGRELESSGRAIRNRFVQADRDEGRREDGLTTVEREEQARLRRENPGLRMVRDWGQSGSWQSQFRKSPGLGRAFLDDKACRVTTRGYSATVK